MHPFITSAAAEQLVQRATDLLQSAQWSEIGAGLAVLIGRRVSEILLSRFEPCSAWSIHFRDPAKKTPELAADFVIEIPTLAPAEPVLTAIGRLQRTLKVDDLKAAALTPKGAKQKVNQRFSSAISSACNRHFAGLVQSRDQRDDLYSHLFRAIYATIAAHWFCPPQVPEHNFKAEIQGHFSIGADGSKLPNFSARANYDDYAIGTAAGNRDGRLGIKLDRPGVSVIRAFRPDADQRQLTALPMAIGFDSPISSPPQTAMPPVKLASLRFDSRDRDRWLNLLDLLAPDASSQPERMEQLLDWAESQIHQAIHQTTEPPEPAEPAPPPAEAIPELAKTLSWLTGRIEALEAEATALGASRG